jgi:hypothetical protein
MLWPQPAQAGVPLWQWDGNVWQPAGTQASPGAVRYDIPQNTTAAQQAQAQANIGATFGGLINKFINGTMDVWQRGTGGLTITTSGGFGADRWWVLPTGASVTVAPVAGLYSYYSMKITGAASVTDVQVKQRIESYIAAPLNGQNVTVQAKIYNNTGGAITPLLTVRTPATQDAWGGTITTIVNAQALQSCAVGAWITVAYTFLCSASLAGLEVAFDFGNNFSTTAKTLQISECDIRVTPGETLGVNNVPPLAELRPITVEYHHCCRYYQYNNGNLYGTTAPTGGAAYATWSFKTQMRATPTIAGTAPATTYQNACVDSVQCYNSTAGNYAVLYAGATASAELFP